MLRLGRWLWRAAAGALRGPALCLAVQALVLGVLGMHAMATDHHLHLPDSAVPSGHEAWSAPVAHVTSRAGHASPGTPDPHLAADAVPVAARGLFPSPATNPATSPGASSLATPVPGLLPNPASGEILEPAAPCHGGCGPGGTVEMCLAVLVLVSLLARRHGPWIAVRGWRGGVARVSPTGVRVPGRPVSLSMLCVIRI